MLGPKRITPRQQVRRRRTPSGSNPRSTEREADSGQQRIITSDRSRERRAREQDEQGASRRRPPPPPNPFETGTFEEEAAPARSDVPPPPPNPFEDGTFGVDENAARPRDSSTLSETTVAGRNAGARREAFREAREALDLDTSPSEVEVETPRESARRESRRPQRAFEREGRDLVDGLQEEDAAGSLREPESLPARAPAQTLSSDAPATGSPSFRQQVQDSLGDIRYDGGSIEVDGRSVLSELAAIKGTSVGDLASRRERSRFRHLSGLVNDGRATEEQAQEFTALAQSLATPEELSQALAAARARGERQAARGEASQRSFEREVAEEQERERRAPSTTLEFSGENLPTHQADSAVQPSPDTPPAPVAADRTQDPEGGERGSPQAFAVFRPREDADTRSTREIAAEAYEQAQSEPDAPEVFEYTAPASREEGVVRQAFGVSGGADRTIAQQEREQRQAEAEVEHARNVALQRLARSASGSGDETIAEQERQQTSAERLSLGQARENVAQQARYEAWRRQYGIPLDVSHEEAIRRFEAVTGPDASDDARAIASQESEGQLRAVALQLGLPADATYQQVIERLDVRGPDASDDVRAIASQESQGRLRAVALQMGLPADATHDQVVRRLELQQIARAVDADKAADAAEPQQMAYERYVRDLGLDPSTATPEQVRNRHELRVREAVGDFQQPDDGVDPTLAAKRVATQQALANAEAAIERQRDEWIRLNTEQATGTSPTAGTRTEEEWGRLFDEQVAPGLRRQARASLDDPAAAAREPSGGLLDRASRALNVGLDYAGKGVDRVTNLPSQAGPLGLVQQAVRGAGAASPGVAAGVIAPSAYSGMRELSPYQLEELARRGQGYEYDEKTGLYVPKTTDSLLPEYDSFQADVARAAPTGGAVVVGGVKALTPIGYAADFHRMGTGGRIAGAGLEAAGFLPGIGQVSKVVRSGGRWGQGVRRAAAAYATGPVQAALHPIDTAKSGGRLADAWINPYSIPEAGVELTRTTTRVPVRGLSGADLSDVNAPSVTRDTQFYSEAQAAATKQASDELTQQLIKGERARVEVGDRVIEVAPAPFQRATGPAMFSSGPNVQFWEQSGGSRGFRSVEGESFFAPSYHGRFAGGGAFGSTTEPGGIGGAVIIRDPKFLEQIGYSGKTYTPRAGGRPLQRAEVAEIEATLQQPQNYPEVSSTYRLWGDRNVITPPRENVAETVEKLIEAGQVDEANQLLRTGSFDLGRKQRLAVIDRQPSRTPVYTGREGPGPDTLRGLSVVDDPDALSVGDLYRVKGQAALENIRRLDPRFKAVRISNADLADDLLRQADELEAAGDVGEAARLRSRSDDIRADLRRISDDAAEEAGRVSGGLRLASEAVRARDGQEIQDRRDAQAVDGDDARRTDVAADGDDFSPTRREYSDSDIESGRAARVGEGDDDSLLRSTFDLPEDTPRVPGDAPVGDVARAGAPPTGEQPRTPIDVPVDDVRTSTPVTGEQPRTPTDVPTADDARVPGQPTTDDPIRTVTERPTDTPFRTPTDPPTDDPIRTVTEPPVDDPVRTPPPDDPARTPPTEEVVRTPTDPPTDDPIRTPGLPPPTEIVTTTDPPPTTEEVTRTEPPPPPPDEPPPPVRTPPWESSSTTEAPPTERPPDRDPEETQQRIEDPQPAPRPEGGFPRAVAHRETVEYSYDPETEQFSAKVVSTSEPVVVRWDYSQPTSEERAVGSYAITPLNDRVDAVREQGEVTIPESVKARLQREAGQTGGPVSTTATLRFEHDLDDRSTEVKTNTAGQSRSPRERTTARLAALTGRAPAQSSGQGREPQGGLASKYLSALTRSNREAARNGGGGRQRSGRSNRRPEKMNYELPEIEVVVGGPMR